MKEIKQLTFGHILTAATMILALYLFVMLVIGIVVSLGSYFLALIFSLLMTYVATEALSLFIQDLKDSAALAELKSIDGLTIAQRTIKNLTEF